TALLLVRDSEAYLPMALTEMEARARKPRFVVVRQGISGAEEIEADANTALQPGDTLVVELPLAAMLPEQVMEPHSVDHDGGSVIRRLMDEARAAAARSFGGGCASATDRPS